MSKDILDVVMWFFILLVVIAALRNPKGFSQDITAVGNTGSGFAGTILGNVPKS